MYHPENMKIRGPTLMQPGEGVHIGSEFHQDNFIYGLEVEFATLFFFLVMFCIEFTRNCRHISKQFEAIYSASWLDTGFPRKNPHSTLRRALLNGSTVREVTSSGGIMRDRATSVTLIVPEGAVPEGANYSIKHNPVTDQLCIPENETLVSPVAEFLTHGTFNKHVQVYLPISRQQHVTSSEISVYYRSSSTDPWKPIRSGMTDGDIFYEQRDDHVIVHTTHFTQFMCTGCKGAVKERDLRLSAILFLYHPEEEKDKQEVQLTVYVVDKDLVPADFMKELKNEKGIMKKIPIDIPPLPDGACYTGKDMLEVQVLAEPDWEVVKTDKDGKLNPGLKAKMLDNLVRCHGQFGKRILAKYFVQRSAAVGLKTNIYIEMEFKLQTKPTKGKETKIHVASFNERIDFGQFLKNIPVVTNPASVQNQPERDSVSLDDGISMGPEEDKEEQMEPVHKEESDANPKEDGPSEPPKKPRMSEDKIPPEAAYEGRTDGPEAYDETDKPFDDTQEQESVDSPPDSSSQTDSAKEMSSKPVAVLLGEPKDDISAQTAKNTNEGNIQKHSEQVPLSPPNTFDQGQQVLTTGSTEDFGKMVRDDMDPAQTSLNGTGHDELTDGHTAHEESTEETKHEVSTEDSPEPPAIPDNTPEMSSKPAEVSVEKPKTGTTEEEVKNTNEGNIHKPSGQESLLAPIPFDHAQQPYNTDTTEDIRKVIGHGSEAAETRIHETYLGGRTDGQATYEEFGTTNDETQHEISTVCPPYPPAVTPNTKEEENAQTHPQFPAFHPKEEENKENIVQARTEGALPLQPEANQKHAVLTTDSDVTVAENGRPRSYSLHDDDQPSETTKNNTGEMSKHYSPEQTSFENSASSYPTDVTKSESGPLDVDNISENSSLSKEDQEPMEKEDSQLVFETPTNENKFFTESTGRKKSQGHPTDVSSVQPGIGHRGSDVGDENHGNMASAGNANSVMSTDNNYEDQQSGDQDYPESEGIYSLRQADSEKDPNDPKKKEDHPIGSAAASHRLETSKAEVGPPSVDSIRSDGHETPYRSSTYDFRKKDEIGDLGPGVSYGNDEKVTSAETSVVTSDNKYIDQLNGNRDGQDSREFFSWEPNDSEEDAGFNICEQRQRKPMVYTGQRLVTTSYGMTSSGRIMAYNGRRTCGETNVNSVDYNDDMTDPYGETTVVNGNIVRTVGNPQTEQHITSSESIPWDGKRLVTTRRGMTHFSPSIQGTGYRGYIM